MNFDEYTKKFTELQEQIKVANDELATAADDESKAKSVDKLADLNLKMTTLKDTFIQEQNDAYIELSAKYTKSEQERMQALQIASNKANEQPKIERDPRKIFIAGMNGGN